MSNPSNRVRKLSGELLVDGTAIPFEECDVEQTALQTPDTFHATLALNAASKGRDLAYLANAEQMAIEVKISGKTLFTGSCDKVEPDWTAGTITMSGRDKMKDLVDTKSTETFKNLPAEYIVRKLAARHGLDFFTDGASKIAGKKYEIDYTQISDLDSEWAIIQSLCDQTDKTAFVRQTTLYFVAIDSLDFGSLNIEYTPQSKQAHAKGTPVSLRAHHNLELARKTTVEIQSHNSATEDTFSASGSALGAEPERKFDYRAAGMEAGTLRHSVDKRLKELVRHERQVTVELPGTTSLVPLMRLNLSGTGTAFDQGYQIDKVDHRLDSKASSYTCKLEGKAMTSGRSMAPAQASFGSGF